MTYPNVPKFAIPVGYNIRYETKTGQIFLILKQFENGGKGGLNLVAPVCRIIDSFDGRGGELGCQIQKLVLNDSEGAKFKQEQSCLLAFIDLHGEFPVHSFFAF